MGKVKLGDIAVLINGDRGKNYPSQKEIITSGGMISPLSSRQVK